MRTVDLNAKVAEEFRVFFRKIGVSLRITSEVHIQVAALHWLDYCHRHQLVDADPRLLKALAGWRETEGDPSRWVGEQLEFAKWLRWRLSLVVF